MPLSIVARVACSCGGRGEAARAGPRLGSGSGLSNGHSYLGDVTSRRAGGRMIVRAERPSSIVPPRTGIGEKGIGDIGQQPPARRSAPTRQGIKKENLPAMATAAAAPRRVRVGLLAAALALGLFARARSGRERTRRGPLSVRFRSGCCARRPRGSTAVAAAASVSFAPTARAPSSPRPVNPCSRAGVARMDTLR